MLEVEPTGQRGRSWPPEVVETETQPSPVSRMTIFSITFARGRYLLTDYFQKHSLGGCGSDWA